MIGSFAGTRDQQDWRFGNKRSKTSLYVLLFLTCDCNGLFGLRAGDDDKGLSLRKTGARCMTRKVEDAVNDLRVHWPVCKISHHASLQNDISQLHRMLL